MLQHERAWLEKAQLQLAAQALNLRKRCAMCTPVHKSLATHISHKRELIVYTVAGFGRAGRETF
jgi:hypothetical protein